ncbi:histidine kinase [Micromonospora sp. URMC 106]
MEEAKRTREEAAGRRASEERLRVARELPDPLTHEISVIKVQAGVAVHLARKRGEEAPPALAAAGEAAREATHERRATLGALLGDEGGPALRGSWAVRSPGGADGTVFHTVTTSLPVVCRRTKSTHA